MINDSTNENKLIHSAVGRLNNLPSEKPSKNSVENTSTMPSAVANAKSAQASHAIRITVARVEVFLKREKTIKSITPHTDATITPELKSSTDTKL